MNKKPVRVRPGVAVAVAVFLACRPALAYVEAAYPLGKLIGESTHIVLLSVESVDKEKHLIVYRKVRDIKGNDPAETVKHNIGTFGFHPREWQTVMAWADVGRTALLFHNGSAGEVCIDGYWYQCYKGDWWRMSHAEPYLLRTYAGTPEKLATAVSRMLAGEEVVVPCMVDGDKNALQLRSARVQRLRSSLSILDYNPTRDFVGWGVEEFRAIQGMPGFTHSAPLSKVSPGSGGVVAEDLDGDGRTDFCLYGASRLALLQNAKGTLNEVSLGLRCGARGAAWADFNDDGKPDLLLATPEGPRLFANLGGKFKDLSEGLPRQGHYNLTAAVWLDGDGDGRPDILLADGFRGLRLLRNKGADIKEAGKPTLGPWHYAGPFDNTNGAGFDAAYPPEARVDLEAEYTGKGNQKVVWQQGKFTDGQVNSLTIFGADGNSNAVAYVYREIDLGGAGEVAASFGSDDGLAVWLNGEKIVSQNTSRGCAADQALATLKLRPGRNELLLKVCQGGGDFAFYFAAKAPKTVMPMLFEDISDRCGLGEGGIGGRLKGSHLLVADVDRDGDADFLYGAGGGVLGICTGGGFIESKGSGIAYDPSGVSPAFGDVDGDGAPDLFVPQKGKSRLFMNDGRGRFADVTDRSGALGAHMGAATCAAWADFSGTGRLDLLVGCLKAPNRYLRNQGDGTFEDATDEIGLSRRIFNTRGLCTLDLNKDGVLDVVFSNEGQESTILLGSQSRMRGRP
ncbi:VCBS repeat-containing protein [bacterium]|nr:VCBS repeat-containing protein [bacterium]